VPGEVPLDLATRFLLQDSLTTFWPLSDVLLQGRVTSSLYCATVVQVRSLVLFSLHFSNCMLGFEHGKCISFINCDRDVFITSLVYNIYWHSRKPSLIQRGLHVLQGVMLRVPLNDSPWRQVVSSARRVRPCKCEALTQSYRPDGLTPARGETLTSSPFLFLFHLNTRTDTNSN
jgi:hypothetical protein